MAHIPILVIEDSTSPQVAGLALLLLMRDKVFNMVTAEQFHASNTMPPSIPIRPMPTAEIDFIKPDRGVIPDRYNHKYRRK